MYCVKDKWHIVWMIIDFKRRSTKSHETVHTVQAKPREIHNKEKKENTPPKMMTLQPNSVFFFTFNLFYLIVFHLSSLGGEVITTLQYNSSQKPQLRSRVHCVKGYCGKRYFHKKCLGKCQLFGIKWLSWYPYLSKQCKQIGCIYAIRDCNYTVKAMISAKLLLTLNCQDYAHYCTIISKDGRGK